ncbi:MAG: hypothetical protein BGO96_15565 [Micrococcales bacterium 73-15]|nr:MAG: hypothetical protein BGO96_15565 [Micrococcales bacterium 73-15]
MVLTAFRGLDGVASFGADSAGLTSGNVATPLADGALIVDRAGVNLDNQPIAPGHVVGTLYADRDAREWLATQGCG